MDNKNLKVGCALNNISGLRVRIVQYFITYIGFEVP